MPRVLVTGCEGFIPAALTEKLITLGHEVVGIDIIPHGAQKNKGYRYVQADIQNLLEIETALREVDFVYHFAALSNLNEARDDPLRTVSVNVMGTANIAEACRRNKAKLIFASSAHVYGPQSGYPVTENSIPVPEGIYAASKLASEELLRAFGIRSTILRLGTTYGPGMRKELAIHIFLSKAAKGEDMPIFSPGSQMRQYAYVDDVVNGAVSAMRPESDGQTINLPGPEGISVVGLAQLCIDITQSKSKVLLLPSRAVDFDFEFISYEKAKYLLKWSPKVHLREGLQRTADWIRTTDGSLHEVSTPRETVNSNNYVLGRSQG